MTKLAHIHSPESSSAYSSSSASGSGSQGAFDSSNRRSFGTSSNRPVRDGRDRSSNRDRRAKIIWEFVVVKHWSTNQVLGITRNTPIRMHVFCGRFPNFSPLPSVDILPVPFYLFLSTNNIVYIYSKMQNKFHLYRSQYVEYFCFHRYLFQLRIQYFLEKGAKLVLTNLPKQRMKKKKNLR